MLPFSLWPIWLSRKYGDNAVLVIGLIMMIVGSFIKLNYVVNVIEHAAQYYVGSVIFFSSTLFSEMAAISIVAKIISPRLKKSYWNAGLLGGTADTGGRVFGNALYTAFSLGITNIANITTVAYALWGTLAVVAMALTLVFFQKLKRHIEIHFIKNKVK